MESKWKVKVQSIKKCIDNLKIIVIIVKSGADLGVGADASFEDSTPWMKQRGPLSTILRYLFMVTNPKTFSKGDFSANILILRGKRAPKKFDFWS